MARKIRTGKKKQRNKRFQILFTWSSYLPNDNIAYYLSSSFFPPPQNKLIYSFQCSVNFLKTLLSWYIKDNIKWQPIGEGEMWHFLMKVWEILWSSRDWRGGRGQSDWENVSDSNRDYGKQNLMATKES